MPIGQAEAGSACNHGIDEICEAFKSLDAIFIAHFHQKKPAIPEADGKKLDALVKEPHRIFKETANENSMNIFTNYRYNALVGSDVKDWNQYEDCTFSELKLPVDSFEQFCLLARRDISVVQTLLNKKQSKKLIAHPAESIDLPIQIYSDMNIIFGPKGTGKTEIIKSLHDSMISSGIKCVKYVAMEREEDFKSLLKRGSLVADLTKLGVESCDEYFGILFSWADSNPINFQNYLDWKRTEGNNANKMRMKITSATTLSRQQRENEETHKRDRKTIVDIHRDIKKIDIDEYLEGNDIEILRDLIDKLKRNIFDSRFKDLVEQYAVGLVNFSINKIKEVADKSTNSVSKPSTTGLSEYTENRLKLLRATKAILKNLSASETNDKEKLGSLDDKGDIFINTKCRMLCASSKADEFKCGIRKLKETKEKLEFIRDHVFDSNISDCVRQFKDLCSEHDITSVDPFVGFSKQIVNANAELYSPSNGEKGMLLLQRTIMNDADAYFLDEPELGMGSSYIDKSIRPMLVDLAKRHKYVTVATHNANIAVRTLPYTSIYRTHSNGVYSTYVGNPFTDRLVNIDDEKDALNWAEESLKSLEGSRDAFYERKDIYESNNVESESIR